METPRSGVITLEVVLRFVDLATDALAAAREEIDALNVYPVPDGDTGTNMYLTVTSGRDAIRAAAEADPGVDVGVALAAFARGALLGARGNSGVILSEMLGAIARRVAQAAPDERNAQVMTQALRCASDASYAAVGTPVEGTMLTVIRAAAEAAEALDPVTTRARDVFVAGAAGAREALARTPELLPVLAQAGVIDAGGRGVSVILDAAETVLTGRRPVPVTSPLGARHIPVPQQGLAGDLSPDGPAYEVMYLLDAEDDAVAPLRAALGGLGDSLVVVGGDGIWNVHVHVDDVGAAIEAGIVAGRPHRIRVTHFAEQVAAAAPRDTGRTGRRIVAVAAGDGLAALFEEAEAVVVRGGPGQRASTGELHEAIVACGAAEIAARTAEADLGGAIRVAVIPTHAQVTGLAAIAVHEPGRAFDQDVLEMTATARHARQGAVTVAAKQAMTMAGPCEPGDVLGVIAGDFAVVGDNLFTVATEVLERLLAGGGELVTIVAGEEDADGSLATRCAAYVEDRHPAVDVVVYDGGQPRYPLLMSAE